MIHELLVALVLLYVAIVGFGGLFSYMVLMLAYGTADAPQD